MIRRILEELPDMVVQMGYYETVKFIISLAWSKGAREVVMMDFEPIDVVW